MVWMSISREMKLSNNRIATLNRCYNSSHITNGTGASTSASSASCSTARSPTPNRASDSTCHFKQDCHVKGDTVSIVVTPATAAATVAPTTPLIVVDACPTDAVVGITQAVPLESAHIKSLPMRLSLILIDEAALNRVIKPETSS